jgi:hypothetical protein
LKAELKLYEHDFHDRIVSPYFDDDKLGPGLLDDIVPEGDGVTLVSLFPSFPSTLSELPELIV